jgi:hypothetical protein
MTAAGFMRACKKISTSYQLSAVCGEQSKDLFKLVY